MKERVVWVDYVKAFCIFFVVLGHSHVSHPIKIFIYAFHIPTFFFISGLFFSFDNYPTYFSFLKKRITQLLLPYLFFNIITYLFWLFIGRNFGLDAENQISPLIPLWGIFYGSPVCHFLEHCIPLWFIICLFSVENIYYVVFYKVKTKFMNLFFIFLFAILGYIDYKYNNFVFPWGINVVLAMICFYGVGSFFKIDHFTHKKTSNNRLFLYLLFSLILLILFAGFNGKIEVAYRDYNNYIYFFIAATFGILFIIQFCKLLFRIFGHINFLQFIGKNTLIILALHSIAGSFIKAFFVYVLNQPLSVFDNNLYAFIYATLSIIILIPVIFFINKYIPFLIGKKTHEISEK